MPASPVFFGEGHTPRVKDTRWRILQKILGALVDGAAFPPIGGTQQVFYGAGAPVGLQPGQVAIVGAVYYDTNPGGITYFWNVGTAGWY